MKPRVRLTVCTLVGFILVLAGQKCLCAWVDDDSGALSRLFSSLRTYSKELHREAVLNAGLEVLKQRITTKREIVRGLLAGEGSLQEALLQFEELLRDAPDEVLPGDTLQEKARYQLLLWLQNRGENDSRNVNKTDRSMLQMMEHVAAGLGTVTTGLGAFGHVLVLLELLTGLGALVAGLGTRMQTVPAKGLARPDSVAARAQTSPQSAQVRTVLACSFLPFASMAAQ